LILLFEVVKNPIISHTVLRVNSLPVSKEVCCGGLTGKNYEYT